MLSYQKYKLQLQKAAKKKTESTRELKRKQKFDEIENIKKQKLTLQKTIDSPWEGFEKETLEADINQDFGSAGLVLLVATWNCWIRYRNGRTVGPSLCSLSS